jgi:hypothetical protein
MNENDCSLFLLFIAFSSINRYPLLRKNALEHDVFRRKHIMLLSYYYRMLFCEKPDSTFSQHALGPARKNQQGSGALRRLVQRMSGQCFP